jgi:hypothetical protein
MHHVLCAHDHHRTLGLQRCSADVPLHYRNIYMPQIVALRLNCLPSWRCIPKFSFHTISIGPFLSTCTSTPFRAAYICHSSSRTILVVIFVFNAGVAFAGFVVTTSLLFLLQRGRRENCGSIYAQNNSAIRRSSKNTLQLGIYCPGWKSGSFARPLTQITFEERNCGHTIYPTLIIPKFAYIH